MKFVKKSTDAQGAVTGDFDLFDAGALHVALQAAGFKGYINADASTVDVVMHPEDDVETIEAVVREHFDSWPGQGLIRAMKIGHEQIDAAAGRARARYVTSVPGQEATYIAKEVDARAYIAADYPATVPANEYLWVKAEAAAMGSTKREAADLIVTQAVQWVVLGSTIERLRRTGKISVGEKTTTEEIADEVKATVDALNSI